MIAFQHSFNKKPQLICNKIRMVMHLLKWAQMTICIINFSGWGGGRGEGERDTPSCSWTCILEENRLFDTASKIGSTAFL